MKTLVHNHSGRPIHLTFPGSAAVHSIRTLLPGVNAVSAETWEAAAQTPSVKRLVDADYLSVIPAAKSPAAATENKLPASDKEALKLVADTVDKALLESWLASEKRGAVKKALSAQLDKIKPGPGEDETKTEE